MPDMGASPHAASSGSSAIASCRSRGSSNPLVRSQSRTVRGAGIAGRDRGLEQDAGIARFALHPVVLDGQASAAAASPRSRSR